MAITSDQIISRFGTGEGQAMLLSAGIGANQQLYRGTVALLSGSGAVTKGYLKNSDTPGASDTVVGILSQYAAGTGADAIPGLLGGTTDGATAASILTGAFLLASGSGADQLSAATAGQTVYLINSVTVGLTSASSTRPIAGVQMPAADVANLPVGIGGLFPILLGTNPLGGI
jgi:hypothetical protein